MYLIDTIEITGFRGRGTPLKIELDAGVNFLIGRNGTGKTTLINLINAILSVDIASIAQSPFQHATIRLKKKGSARRPILSVRKFIDQNQETSIEYSIKETTKSLPNTVTFEDVSSFIRSRNMRVHGLYSADLFERSLYNRHFEERNSSASRISKNISSLISVSWLSVYRNVSLSKEIDEKYDSEIDKKVTQISRDFGSYFSELDKKAAEATDAFQKTCFLALLHSSSRIEHILSIGRMNFENERDSLKSIFEEFGMKPSSYNSKLDSHFKIVRKASEVRKSQRIPASDFSAMVDTIRIHELVQEWHLLLDHRKQIYEPKDNFVNVINSLFYEKSLSITNGNLPVLKGTSGNIPMLSLSSGEKQLFIILGETLLQREKQCVFLADEPELSLHVDWQVNLVPHLRSINPNVQVIFATHSPDIVGRYQDRAISMEAIQ